MESARLLLPTLRRSSRVLSRTHLLRGYSSENPKAQEVATREKIHLTKPSAVRWKRPPFMKNLFIGKFDTELLAFPEIMDKDQLAELESNVKIINDLMIKKANSSEIDKKGKLPEDLLQDLKELGLFGRLIPLKYGGLDMCHSACTRMNEALSLDWATAASLAAHEFFATQVLLEFGSEEQKNRLLPQLASGSMVAALCCSEFQSGSDPLSMATMAKQTPDGNFIIHGSKAWVTNAEEADTFIVFAKTQHPVDPKAYEISAFLIERNTEGLEVVPQNKTCLRGTGSGIVHLNEVILSPTNLIGVQGMGFMIYLKALDTLRVGLHSFTFGTLKALVDAITQRVIDSERFEKSLGDHQLVRRRLAQISTLIYAMESVAYFTAAILDSSENPDMGLESAAMKVFNSEGTLHVLRELQALVGSSSLMQEFQLERFLRDATGISMMDGPNDIARLFIGLNGLRHAGFKKTDDIMKMRNTFFFPWETIKKHWRHFKIKNNLFKFSQDVAGNIHPSLVEWGNHLEMCLQKFELAVESVLRDHGKKVVETQIDPMKLADIAVNIYAMTAVLSRSSRSYCIGLTNSHHELRLAQAFCHDANVRAVHNLTEIMVGVGRSNERNYSLLGDQIIDCKGYFPEHPLKRNY